MDNYKKKLTEYYNKFSEDKRLLRRHGQVEYITTMKFIHDYLFKGCSILDIGAGTGRYSIALRKEGYDVTAVELTRPNIAVMKANDPGIEVHEADARDLRVLKDRKYDIVLLFGPLYHLHKKEDKLMAIAEAKKHLKEDGKLFVAYLMNDYALIYHAFISGHYTETKGSIDTDFRITDSGNDLYSYVRIEDISELNSLSDMERIAIFAADGPSDYIRPILNKMDDETFEGYLNYHLSTCQRSDLLGASSHLVDIIRKK